MKLSKKSLIKYLLTEDIEKHETLNPLLWNSDNTLKAEVKEKIDMIVEQFLDGLTENEVTINVTDIELVGSNCSYNYTKDSDLDIHVFCDTESLECPEDLYAKLYSAYRSLFEKKFDIYFYGIPVEIFVETENGTINSNGIYSVTAQKWLKEPTVESIPEIDQDALNAAFEPWEERYNDIMNRAETEGISAVKDLHEDFEKPKSIIADQIRGEWDAIKNYHAAADDLSNIDGSFDNVINTLNSIADEEEVHVGELTSALSEIDDNVSDNIKDGQKEYAEDNSEEQKLTESVSTPLIDDIDKLIEDIYEQRKIGLAEGGEPDIKNLLFKEFRNKGYLDNLKALKNKLISKELSLKEQQELEEDTEKVSDHKWVNKGKEGTHGTFKTKKEADAQRKAMFANGFSEDLEEQLNYDEIRQKFAEVIGGGYQPLVQQNGRFDFYDLDDNAAKNIVNALTGQDFIKFVGKRETSKFNYSKMRFNGLPERYYNVYGQVEQQELYEDISDFDYEAFVRTIKEMDKKNPQKALDYVYRDEFKPHIRIGRQESTDYKGYDSYTNYIIKDEDNKHLYTIRIDD